MIFAPSRLRNSAPLRVLLKTQFGRYLFGNTISLVGTWMQRIACSWLVWDWTGSAFWVGILAACDLLPVVVISPFAGVAADRWDRLRMNVVAQVISAANALALAVLVATGHLGLSGVLALTLVQGTLTAATQPSRFAMVQQMVTRADVGAAVGLNSACVNIARLLGPAAAGAMILNWSTIWVFASNTAVTVLFVAILLTLRLAERPPQAGRAPFLKQLTEGFAYAFGTPALRLGLIALFAGGALVRSVVELMPVIAAATFFDEITGLAVLTGAAAVGAILSGVTVGNRPPVALLCSVPVWWGLGAISSVALTQAPAPWLAALAAVVLGGAITRGLVSTQTFIQLTTPDALRGRALSVFGLFARGSPALGALAIGYGVDLFGLGNATLASAGLLLAVLALLGTRIPRATASITDPC